MQGDGRPADSPQVEHSSTTRPKRGVKPTLSCKLLPPSDGSTEPNPGITGVGRDLSSPTLSRAELNAKAAISFAAFCRGSSLSKPPATTGCACRSPARTRRRRPRAAPADALGPQEPPAGDGAQSRAPPDTRPPSALRAATRLSASWICQHFHRSPAPHSATEVFRTTLNTNPISAALSHASSITAMPGSSIMPAQKTGGTICSVHWTRRTEIRKGKGNPREEIKKGRPCNTNQIGAA